MVSETAAMAIPANVASACFNHLRAGTNFQLLSLDRIKLRHAGTPVERAEQHLENFGNVTEPR